MHRVCLLLLGMVSLVASGVIMERGGRVDPGNIFGIRYTLGGANVMTRDELLRQKFILDILHFIYDPLQQQDLLMLDDRNIITNRSLYMRPLTQEMQIVLDLINANQMLSKQDVCSISNEEHVLQAVGFYRLLVTARDFDTFQRLAVYGRKNINTEMFVHCLVLALGERQDTQMLIVPALHDIMYEDFGDYQFVNQVRQLDTEESSMRASLFDYKGHDVVHLRQHIADQKPQGLLSQDISLKHYVRKLIYKFLFNTHKKENKISTTNEFWLMFPKTGNETVMDRNTYTRRDNNTQEGERANKTVSDNDGGVLYDHVDDDVNEEYFRNIKRPNMNFSSTDINDERLLYNNNTKVRDAVSDNYSGEKQERRLLWHVLQQLVARLNIERIALGQHQLIDNTPNNFGPYSMFNVNLQHDIKRIEFAWRLKTYHISVLNYNQMINEIVIAFAKRNHDFNFIDILGNAFLEKNLVENEATQILLARILRIVDQNLQELYHQRLEFISTVQGVNINNVEIDKLQTYLKPYGSQRFDHREFNIKIDVTSDRQQQVVVRNLLVPRIDGLNNIIPMMERRQNVIVLDITTVELQQGRNSLKLNSNDFTMTSRDTTPLTTIYQIVMQALNGDRVFQRDLRNGQSTLLPHHLLLPRGRTSGLHMQLITVITPMQATTGVHRDNGWNTLLLDNLPLNYPLHSDITDLDRLNSMPNLMIQDVKIYHEDSIKTPFLDYV